MYGGNLRVNYVCYHGNLTTICTAIKELLAIDLGIDQGVYNQWTGLLEWNAAVDNFIGIFLVFTHFWVV